MTQRRSAVIAATCFVTLTAIAPVQAAGNYNRHNTYRRTHASTSRGWTSAQATVVGRLAQITSQSAQIRGGRDRGGRVLSVCPQGQYLAITTQTSSSYGVLMADRSIGYIAKADVRLLAYQVVNNQPTSTEQGSAQATPDDGSLGSRLVQQAFTYLSVPYLWGGESRDGIDCSAFVRAVFESEGLSLPRVSRDQATVGYDVPRENVAEWMPGDRMYFACHHPEIDHTAMYIGNGEFIHASAGHGHQVAIDSVYNSYYSAHLVAVRRSVELWQDQQRMAGRDQQQQPTETMQSQSTTASTGVTNGAPTSAMLQDQDQQQQQASTTDSSSQSQSSYVGPSQDQYPTMASVPQNRSVPPADDATQASNDPESNQQ